MAAYSENARLEDGYNRGSSAWSPYSSKPVVGSKGFEQSNLTNAWMAGWDAKQQEWEASQNQGSGDSGGGSSYTAPTGLLPAPSTPTPEPINPPSPMVITDLNLRPGASTVYQLNKLQSIDSLPMKQAEVNAFERGVASGAIHGSQQAGAAQRAVTDKLTPLAQAEASLIANEDVSNWKAQVEQEQKRYETEYNVYLSKLGISAQKQIAMTTANTSLSNTLLSSLTSLMNNPEIEFGEEVKNKLTSVFNTAMQNNNVILDMGFTY